MSRASAGLSTPIDSFHSSELVDVSTFRPAPPLTIFFRQFGRGAPQLIAEGARFRMILTFNPRARLCWLPLVGISCIGQVGCAGTVPPGVETPSTGIRGGRGAGGAVEDPAFVPAPGGFRLLTEVEYANTIRDILGNDIEVPPGIPLAETEGGYHSIAAVTRILEDGHVKKLALAAAAIARQAVAPARRAALASCTPSTATDAACAASLVRALARRMFRRPLTAGEEGPYLQIFTDAAMRPGGDFWGGVEMALVALLQAPDFLYRSELGGQAVAPGAARRLLGHEIATRLSYMLTATTPSAALLDAALRGELDTPDGLRRVIDELLDAPRSQAAFDMFYAGWLSLEELRGSRLSTALQKAMEQETILMLRDAASGAGGGLKGAMVARTTYLNDALAAFYGLPAPGGTGFKKVFLPPNGARIGLLGHGSFLANVRSDVHKRNVLIFRGLAVLERFLCRTLPSVPDNIVEPTLPPKPRTGRQYSEDSRLAGGSCRGCHTGWDPVGFAFEHFDEIGRYRKTDNRLPIDPSGNIAGTPFADAAGLSKLVSEAPDFAACVSKHLYRHATGRVETAEQSERLGRLARRFAQQGWSVRKLAADLAADPLFLTVGDAQ